MTVKELIEELKKMPQDARVFHIWDGEPRTAINVVYEAKSGHVMTADFNEVVYSDCARPKGTYYSLGNWYTPKGTKDYIMEDDHDIYC